MLQEGITLAIGMQINDNCIQRCWHDVITQSDFEFRKQNVDNFNRYAIDVVLAKNIIDMF